MPCTWERAARTSRRECQRSCSGALLLDFLASGMTMEEILEEYPQLTRDDILAAIAYGAEMSRGRFVDLPGQIAA